LWRRKTLRRYRLDTMPTIKRSLPRADLLANLVRARKLRADGVDLQIREEWEESARSLDVLVDGDFAAVVYDLPGGTAAYAIWVRLVARRRVTLTDCRLFTDWDEVITLAGYFDDREPLWWLGHQDFPRRRVLNPRIMNHLRFDGYDSAVEGVILATGLKPIPETRYHGMTVPFTIAFLDQNRDEISNRAELFVDRTAKRERKALGRESSFGCSLGRPKNGEPLVNAHRAKKESVPG
jgi:hypothetical protein